MNIGNAFHQLGKEGKKPEILANPKDVEIIDVNYIIKHKPKPKVVREFLKASLGNIKSEEEVLFDTK